MTAENVALIDATYDSLEFEVSYAKVASASEKAVFSTYIKADKKKFEMRRLAALVAFIYNTPALVASAPMHVPASRLVGERYMIPARYNHPNGGRALNIVLRHAYNFFFSFVGRLYSDDSEGAAADSPALRIRADRICLALEAVFKTLEAADSSKGKDGDAHALFTRIGDYIFSMPSTCAEEHKRAVAEEEARLADVAAKAKAAADKKAAAEAAAAEEEEPW
jgi:hypothetical protein